MRHEWSRNFPAFTLLLDDRRVDHHDRHDPLHLVVEVRGCRGEDAKVKASTAEANWVSSVNRSGSFGRWTFAESTDVYALQDDLDTEVSARLNEVIATTAGETAGAAT